MKVKTRDILTTDIDMTPMIDICFQLLTFFCFILNFDGAEQDERVKLPESELAKPPKKASEVPITLQVTRNGTILAGGSEYRTAEDARALLSVEKTVLEQQGKSATEANIIIRAHKDAKTGDVQDLIRVSQIVGFEKFTLRAKEDQTK